MLSSTRKKHVKAMAEARREVLKRRQRGLAVLNKFVNSRVSSDGSLTLQHLLERIARVQSERNSVKAERKRLKNKIITNSKKYKSKHPNKLPNFVVAYKTGESLVCNNKMRPMCTRYEALRKVVRNLNSECVNLKQAYIRLRTIQNSANISNKSTSQQHTNVRANKSRVVGNKNRMTNMQIDDLQTAFNTDSNFRAYIEKIKGSL